MSRRKLLKGMMWFLVGALVTLVGWASQASAQGPPEWALARVIEVQQAHTPALLERPGVVGTAVGYSRAGALAVKVFLGEGAAAAGIPRRLDGVPVAVEVTGVIFALKPPEGKGPKRKPPAPIVDPTARFDRPVPIGVSTGHPNITAGTIGCRVTDGTNVYALSNNHVYADENQANIGDNVLQPGPYDGGVDPDDAIGTLFDYTVISFCNPYPSNCPFNEMDSAIALSSTALLDNSTPLDGYGPPKSTTTEAKLGMRVMKYGRTTRQSNGRIDAVNASVYVQYDSGVALFENQIVIRPGSFSAGGDSGSLVVVQRGKEARKPVGLLFAGSSSVTIANPIDTVLDRFGVTVDGE